jgi:hypothetical protein
MESRSELVAGSLSGRRQKDRQKSRIANGSAWVNGVDGRSGWIRRLRELVRAHLSDLGGEENTSAAEHSIIRRAATLTVELERLEAKFAVAGEAFADDLETYQRCANTLRRLLEAIGLQRRPREVGPTLSDLLIEQQQRETNEVADG